jgi:putative protease
MVGHIMSEKLVGHVDHYYSGLHVAAVELIDGELKVGDTIHIQGHTTDFVQPVRSLQLDHRFVSEGHVGESIGLKVDHHAREHDDVYLVSAD